MSQPGRRSSVLAFVFSLLIAGSGSMYAGRVAAGTAILLGMILAGTAASAAPGGPLILLPVIMAFVSVIHAEQAVKRHNRAAGYPK
jgi:TM2 domain-containing membrane protein YozV